MHHPKVVVLVHCAFLLGFHRFREPAFVLHQTRSLRCHRVLDHAETMGENQAMQADRNHLVHIPKTSESYHLKLQFFAQQLRCHMVMANEVVNDLDRFLARKR